MKSKPRISGHQMMEVLPLWVMPHDQDVHGMHTHDFHELVLTVDGSGMHHTEEEVYRIQAGDVFVVFPGHSHGYSNTHGLRIVNILYDPLELSLPVMDLGDVPGYHAMFELEPKLRRRNAFRHHLKLAAEELNQADVLAERMRLELTGRGPGFLHQAAAMFMQLTGFLSRCYMAMRNRSTRSLVNLSKILHYLDAHHDEDIRMEDLTRLAAMSESTLRRTFQKATGQNPSEYLIHLRIARAAELLRDDTTRVTEAAVAVGFHDSNYFSRKFSQIMGLSPKAYRERMTEASSL